VEVYLRIVVAFFIFPPQKFEILRNGNSFRLYVRNHENIRNFNNAYSMERLL
jgi:hypothetical protein